jgi:hypothetical protein
MSTRIDLLRNEKLKRTLKSRAFQPFLMLLVLFFFVLAILTGLWGTPAGSHNFSIVYVWIVWWALLMIVLVPFFGRFWCTVCPIPGPAEWFQRRGIIQAIAKPLRTLNRRWPRKLRNIWLQNGAFLGMALFSVIILTRPMVTAWVLLGMILLAIAMGFVYKDRVFCRYVCPVGGFIGLYSLSSSLELRVKDFDVCLKHTTKDCITGNENGYGCPWMEYPGKLDRNAYCGLCTECLKTCPKDNIAINLRPIGSDLLVTNGRRMDEAYKAIIMLTCALVYSGVLLGPWGWLKQWANMDSFFHWSVYALGFLALNLLIIPSIFGFATMISRVLSGANTSLKKLFVEYSYSLVPIGLSGWIAFSLSFVFVNGSYAISVLSDPFGWGWNLFGTRFTPWSPFLTNLMPGFQSIILALGLISSIILAYRIGRQQSLTHSQAWQGTLPVAGFILMITLGFSYLYLG